MGRRNERIKTWGKKIFAVGFREHDAGAAQYSEQFFKIHGDRDSNARPSRNSTMAPPDVAYSSHQPSPEALAEELPFVEASRENGQAHVHFFQPRSAMAVPVPIQDVVSSQHGRSHNAYACAR